MAKKLEKCPWCGSKAKLIENEHGFSVICTSNIATDCFYYCGADDKGGLWTDVISIYTKKEDAINDWNRRS